MVPFLNSMSEVLSRSCFQVSCVGDLGYVYFLFLPNESNIMMFQKCSRTLWEILCLVAVL